MAAVARSVFLRIFLYFVGPCLTILFGWGWASIGISFAFAVVAAILHIYYRNIYVPLPVFLLRVATFTAVQMILAAMVRHQVWSPIASGPTDPIPAVEDVPVIPMENKIASDFLSSNPVITMSIVLPCANEGRYSWLTAQSIAEVTPDDVLKEIIVVDDGSSPPLISQFPKDIMQKAKVRFVRHESHTGLINAKSAGANVATGDVVVFLDCHVRPAANWHQPILEKIRTNYRRVVVPSITGLDPDTWEEVRGNGGTAKCYLTWDSDFKWFDSDDDKVAVMSGGLLAMSRQWWKETGGYDTAMKGWGGENIDQSLRIWLCNGEIVQAKDSYVGHMWRMHDKPETRARYTVPPGSTVVNRYRGAAVWMGDWSEKLETFSSFSRYKSAKPDMASIKAVKDRLQCRDFSYFIDKFYKVYHWAGLLPKQVFQLRDANSGLCLQKTMHDKLALAQCSAIDAGQHWHKANRDGNQCCSGLRNWNTDQCVTGAWVGGAMQTHVCNIGGLSEDQYVSLNNVTHQLEITKRPGACLGGELAVRQRARFAACGDGTVRQVFKKIAVDSAAVRVKGDGGDLVRFEDAKRPGLCLAALGGADAMQGRIEVHDCDINSPLQVFSVVKANDGNLRIKAIGLAPGSKKALCLDAGVGSNEIGLYPCYMDANGNQNAKLATSSNDEITMEFRDNMCVSLPPESQEDNSATKPLTLHGCVSDGDSVKRGQTFEKVVADASHPYIFSLRNKDGNCIAADAKNNFILSRAGCGVHLFNQTSSDANKRLVHIPTGLCFDGNNGITPTLYTCYEGENTNQQVDVSKGFVKLERTDTCIDYEPVTPSPVTAVPCSTAEGTFKWEEYKPFIPLETAIYNRKTRERKP